MIKTSGIQKLVVTLIITTALGTICYADNPIIQTKYTADPAPMVYNDTVYLYTSHDEDDARVSKCLIGCSILQRIWSIGRIMEL